MTPGHQPETNIKKWTILSVLKWTSDYFGQKGIQSARLSAEVLLAHVLKTDRIRLYMQFDHTMDSASLAEYKKVIHRHIQGEPVSYIREIKEFWSLPFRVGPGVLVPRPDTEVLIETVVNVGKAAPEWGLQRILDIGTGSGNIAVALAKEFPHAKITALDVSADAMEYAKQNAGHNHVDSRIDFVHADFFSEWEKADDIYDLVVSNPPYICSAVIDTLPAGIKNYEPRLALDGGPDGLAFFGRMGKKLGRLLKNGGYLAVETGEDQAENVRLILQNSGLSDGRVIKDYAGFSRVVCGIWKK